MRSFVLSTFMLAVAFAPALAAAQPPAAQPPAGQQPPAQGTTQQPPATDQPPAGQTPAQPAEPKVGFATGAGLLLVQVKPSETATFEEMIAKIKSGLTASTAPGVSQQAASWHVYKAQEGMNGNALYVVVLDPATPGTEYQFLEVLNNTLTDEQKRDPATQDMYKRYADAIASMNRLNLTKVGGQ
jgi:hypothetical protein